MVSLGPKCEGSPPPGPGPVRGDPGPGAPGGPDYWIGPQLVLAFPPLRRKKRKDGAPAFSHYGPDHLDQALDAVRGLRYFFLTRERRLIQLMQSEYSSCFVREVTEA